MRRKEGRLFGLPNVDGSIFNRGRGPHESLRATREAAIRLATAEINCLSEIIKNPNNEDPDTKREIDRIRVMSLQPNHEDDVYHSIKMVQIHWNLSPASVSSDARHLVEAICKLTKNKIPKGSSELTKEEVVKRLEALFSPKNQAKS